uniref:Central tail fiber J n=1 Tax=Pseudomonas phage PACT201 TaxID=3230130 RepID=A0AAU8GS87_9VIRU
MRYDSCACPLAQPAGAGFVREHQWGAHCSTRSMSPRMALLTRPYSARLSTGRTLRLTTVLIGSTLPAGGHWAVRVRRITPEANSSLVQDTMMLTAIAEVCRQQPGVSAHRRWLRGV